METTFVICTRVTGQLPGFLLSLGPWQPDSCLKVLYQYALSPELQDELTCRGEAHLSENYVQLSVTLDNTISDRPRYYHRAKSAVPSSAPSGDSSEPMQLS